MPLLDFFDRTNDMRIRNMINLAALKKRSVLVARLAVCLFTGLPVNGQSPNVPAFRFSKLNQAGVVTDKNVPAGKKSLFVFFDVTCPHCHDAIKSFSKNYRLLDPVSVYLITEDSQPAAVAFLSHNAKELWQRKNVTVLLDTYREFIEKFKPVKYPSMFLYSETKRLLLYSDEPKDVAKILIKIKGE